MGLIHFLFVPIFCLSRLSNLFLCSSSSNLKERKPTEHLRKVSPCFTKSFFFKYVWFKWNYLTLSLSVYLYISRCIFFCVVSWCDYTRICATCIYVPDEFDIIFIVIKVMFFPFILYSSGLVKMMNFIFFEENEKNNFAWAFRPTGGGSRSTGMFELTRSHDSIRFNGDFKWRLFRFHLFKRSVESWSKGRKWGSWILFLFDLNDGRIVSSWVRV